VTPTPAKHTLLGVNISATSYEEVANVCSRWIEDRSSSQAARYICVTSVHGIITGRHDPAVRDVLNEADIATPDGMPVVWALRSFGLRRQQRVYGPTLMLHLCQAAADAGHGIYLFGGSTETVSQLRHNLIKRFPTLNIAGYHSPPFRPATFEEDERTKMEIRESGARLLFVGISTPKQELWMRDHKQAFPGLVMVGVGAAFDFHAGRVKQAPSWMQGSGLEWFFRLCSEPRRLWRRYLLVTPQFLPLWAWQWLDFHIRGRIARS
jgi:N-acetylglucosaminyldiphosphoundecaprenol N-acetyl-beta-D-mannosaminyltransferase